MTRLPSVRRTDRPARRSGGYCHLVHEQCPGHYPSRASTTNGVPRLSARAYDRETPCVGCTAFDIASGGSGSTIRGLAIGRFDTGVILNGAASCTIEGNFIGTDPTGTIARANAHEGIRLDIAIGNLIGSSTYNIGLVLGSSALVAPLAVTPELARVDLPVMAAVMLLCIPVLLTGRRMSRGEGIGFVLAYVIYLGLLIAFRT